MALVTISEAAKALGRNKSTVSRWVTSHPELNHAPDGQAPRVDLDELRAHRGLNVNAARSGNHAGHLLGEAESALAVQGQGHEGGGQITYAAEKARRERAQRIKAERANDEDAGRLVPRGEIEEAIADVVGPVREALEGVGASVAHEVAEADDPRAAQRLIDRAVRDALEGIADGLHDAIRRVAGDAPDGTADTA